MARENREQTDATQRTLLAESYFGLRLAQEVARVRQDTYRSLQRHYENALKLESAGMIDKAGRLFAQVNMDEAQRSLEASQKEVAQYGRHLRHTAYFPTLHKCRPTRQGRAPANHANRELHRQPIAVTVAHRQATAPYRPKRIPARHRRIRQTDIVRPRHPSPAP